MQDPIRYYITKSGEEPTVRSVRVALGPAENAVETEPTALADTAIAEPTQMRKQVGEQAIDVKRRVKAAMRRTRLDAD